MGWLLLGIVFFIFFLWCDAESEGRGWHLLENWHYSANSYESTDEDPDYDPEDHVARTSSNGW